MGETKSQAFLKGSYSVVDYYMNNRNNILDPTQNRANFTQGLLWACGTVAKQIDEIFTDTNTSTPQQYREGDMFGACTVKDLDGNRHFFASAYNKRGTRHYHIEDWLKRDVNTFWDKQANLNTAKVSFYLWESPCPGCTEKIPDWIPQMVGKITRNGDSKRVFFVFNFGAIYRVQNPAKGQRVWAGAEEAW